MALHSVSEEKKVRKSQNQRPKHLIWAQLLRIPVTFKDVNSYSLDETPATPQPSDAEAMVPSNVWGSFWNNE